jgi:hypothetical protein
MPAWWGRILPQLLNQLLRTLVKKNLETAIEEVADC